jgi:hypothetical protein
MARITLKDKLNDLEPSRRQKVAQRSNELIQEEMTLREIRKAFDLTQVELSQKLHMNQEAVSRLERRSDLLLSTLSSYVSAMGGELTLSAKFPNRPPIQLSGFSRISQKK